MKTENPEKLHAENKEVRSYMIDMIIMLVVTAIVAIYTYGARAAYMVILSVLAAVLTETLASIILMRRKPERIADLSCIFTGLAIALALPSCAPLWLAPVGSIFAIAIAKLPFGNAKTSPFVPAAVGISFLSVTYRELVFTYPSLTIGSLSSSIYDEKFVAGNSLGQMLSVSKSIGTNILNVFDVFVGRIPGPIGASCLILMIGTFVYMLIRRQPGFITTASFVAACCVMAVLFPRVLTGRTYSLLMELSAGLLFYSAVFFISDPVTSPKNQLGKVLYGATAGIAVMLFRYFGNFEDSTCFVVLIMNACSSLFDRWGIKLGEKIQKTNLPKPKKPQLKPISLKKSEEDVPDEGGILDDE